MPASANIQCLKCQCVYPRKSTACPQCGLGANEPYVLPRIIVAPGYMGNLAHWCYWDEEYPEDGSYGPYDSKEEALASVKRFCSWEEVMPPVQVLETSDSPRLMQTMAPVKP